MVSENCLVKETTMPEYFAIALICRRKIHFSSGWRASLGVPEGSADLYASFCDVLLGNVND